MVTQCCVCKKVYDKERKEWINPERVNMSKMVTHTYCPTCIEATRKLFGLKPRNMPLSTLPTK